VGKTERAHAGTGARDAVPLERGPVLGEGPQKEALLLAHSGPGHIVARAAGDVLRRVQAEQPVEGGIGIEDYPPPVQNEHPVREVLENPPAGFLGQSGHDLTSG
jgi:hypothetical protein